MLTKSTLLKHYKRREVQEALLAHAKNKEISFRYGDIFGKRPDILSYPRDVLELALQNVTSFHASEELWSNPLSLNSNLARKDLDQLRIGWDLVLDIDCKFIEYSKICADLVIKFLKYCGVKAVSCKFSGNKGFHIGVPFEAFPDEVGNQPTRELFPEAPRRIALYVKENIKDELGLRILALEDNDFSKVMEKTGAEREKIISYNKNSLGTMVPYLNVEPFLEIDTILLSSRHLYRMPYSLHEKSGLVSLPIDPESVLFFQKDQAQPETMVIPSIIFLDRQNVTESARRLLLQALDFEIKLPTESEPKNSYEEIKIESPIKELFFPPCVKKILLGMEDGKKRSVFILMNFLGQLGWSKEEIKAFILNWNKEKNREPLRANYIFGQLSSFKEKDKLPPNCNNEGYYKGLAICQPDSLCAKIKNPVNYTLIRWKSDLRERMEQKGGETEID